MAVQCAPGRKPAAAALICSCAGFPRKGGRGRGPAASRRTVRAGRAPRLFRKGHPMTAALLPIGTWAPSGTKMAPGVLGGISTPKAPHLWPIGHLGFLTLWLQAPKWPRRRAKLAQVSSPWVHGLPGALKWRPLGCSGVFFTPKMPHLWPTEHPT